MYRHAKMYKNQLIFSPVHCKGQSFLAPRENGDTLSLYATANIGYIEGLKRHIDAIMTDVVAEGDLWYVINIVNGDNIYKKTVAVLGASNEDRARHLALRYIGEPLGVGMLTRMLGTYSYQTIKRFLDHDQSTYHEKISQSDLEQFDNLPTNQATNWAEEKLISHSGNMGHLMLDMLQSDDDAQLLDSMSKSDFAEYAKGLQDVKDELYLIEDQQLDALITPYGRIDILIQRLSQAIGRVGNSKVNVTSITPTKPFKRNGVVNVAVLLDFDDGQTVSIVFHNPDATPTRLAAADVLTSWKWLLNKRDVSAVLQPKNGENVNLGMLAVRMLQLVNKNSARFKRTQVKRDENEQKLQALQSEESNKLQQIQELDGDIANLQLQIDEAIQNHANQSEADAKAEADAQAQLEAEAQAKAEADAQAQLEAEAQAKAEADAQAQLEEEAQAKAEADAQAQLEEEAQAKVEADAQAQLEADAKAQADAQAQLEAEEQAKAQADAQAQLEAEAGKGSNPAEQDSENTDDKEYLQSILDKQVDLSDMDAVENKLTDIWSRVENTELEPLFNDVAKFISDYAVNQYNESE